MNTVINITLQERFSRISSALERLDAIIGYESIPFRTRMTLECEAKLVSMLGTQHQERYAKQWIELLIENIETQKCNDILNI